MAKIYGITGLAPSSGIVKSMGYRLRSSIIRGYPRATNPWEDSWNRSKSRDDLWSQHLLILPSNAWFLKSVDRPVYQKHITTPVGKSGYEDSESSLLKNVLDATAGLELHQNDNQLLTSVRNQPSLFLRGSNSDCTTAMVIQLMIMNTWGKFLWNQCGQSSWIQKASALKFYRSIWTCSLGELRYQVFSTRAPVTVEVDKTADKVTKVSILDVCIF
jgi:hypothetical protein